MSVNDISVPLTAGVGAEPVVSDVVLTYPAGHWFAVWGLDPLVWGFTGFFLWLFWQGRAVRAAQGAPIYPWHSALFIAGVLAIWAALVSPMAYLAGHLFWVRQLQQMLLHLAGPFLIFTARPQAVLFAGMPRRLRHRLLAPLLRLKALRLLGRIATQPFVVSVLFIGTIALWLIPAMQNAALMQSVLGYLMQADMLATGLLFFWVLFDPRDPPEGLGHGVRMVMLTAAGFAAIAMSSVLLLKTETFYTAYDLAGRFFGIAPLDDETTGGFIIWLPSVSMLLVALMTVLHDWNSSEERRWANRNRWTGSNSQALMMPETAEELWMIAAPKNRRVGIGLGIAVISMFFLVIGMATSVHLAH